ncbi:hypothetical protein EVAR_34604_1 [Eumeta japonica]|uniref:Uncharacterized protein n=1 Tax=Eumeta variegata TaxID=151549 RepID=A0A4C1VG12_EUMVA|nr:hypothetical protein EVAR_34604_1 [Eumeta japonica]
MSFELKYIRKKSDRTPLLTTPSLAVEVAKAELRAKTTCAKKIAMTPTLKRNQILILSLTYPKFTVQQAIGGIREALDTKTTGVKVGRVSKAKNEKVVLSCSTGPDLVLIRDRIRATTHHHWPKPKHLVHCKCLGFGHTKIICKEKEALCSFCGGFHIWERCSDRLQGKAPMYRNYIKAKKEKNVNAAHNAFSVECKVRQKRDAIALEVIKDSQLVGETEATAVLITSGLRLEILSIYYKEYQEIELYLRQTQVEIQNVKANYVILAGDVTA